jgi:hypothetical protein
MTDTGTVRVALGVGVVVGDGVGVAMAGTRLAVVVGWLSNVIADAAVVVAIAVPGTNAIVCVALSSGIGVVAVVALGLLWQLAASSRNIICSLRHVIRMVILPFSILKNFPWST